MVKYEWDKAFLAVMRFVGYFYSIFFKRSRARGLIYKYLGCVKSNSQARFWFRISLYFLPGNIDWPKSR